MQMCLFQRWKAPAAPEEILEGLEHASGFLRHELAARVELRSFPRLRFHWDPTPENADHIEKVLRSLHESEPAKSR